MLATTPYNSILVEAADAVGVVTLNRAEKRNALSLEVMRELIAAFEAIGADRSVKVVILRGLGPALLLPSIRPRHREPILAPSLSPRSTTGRRRSPPRC